MIYWEGQHARPTFDGFIIIIVFGTPVLTTSLEFSERNGNELWSSVFDVNRIGPVVSDTGLVWIDLVWLSVDGESVEIPVDADPNDGNDDDNDDNDTGECVGGCDGDDVCRDGCTDCGGDGGDNDDDMADCRGGKCDGDDVCKGDDRDSCNDGRGELTEVGTAG